jgi:hypothetical protein
MKSVDHGVDDSRGFLPHERRQLLEELLARKIGAEKNAG